MLVSPQFIWKKINFFQKESQNFLTQKFKNFYPDNIQSWQDVKEYVLRYSWWKYKLVQHFYTAKGNMHMPTDPAIPYLTIYARSIILYYRNTSHVQNNKCSRTSNTTLCVFPSKIRNTLKCPLVVN